MDGSQLFGYARPIDLAATKTTTRSRWSLKQLLIAGGALLFIAAAAGYGHYYWTTGRFLVSTDDAYVQAHSVLISPKVSGYISEVPVDDNQTVKAGQVMARIDHAITTPRLTRRAPMSRRRRRASTPSISRSPSNGSSSSRTASRSPRIRRRSSIRSRITSATPYWLKTVMARCSRRSKRRPTFAKKTPRSSMTLRS